MGGPKGKRTQLKRICLGEVEGRYDMGMFQLEKAGTYDSGSRDSGGKTNGCLLESIFGGVLISAGRELTLTKAYNPNARSGSVTQENGCVLKAGG